MGLGVEPLFDRIFVVDDPVSTTTASGLHLPHEERRRFASGRVVAVGRGLVRDGQFVPLRVRVGDHVTYRYPGGSVVTVDGVDHRLLREMDVVGIDEG